MSAKLTLIAAIDQNRLLADERGIPWRLPKDIAHFRAYTQCKWLLLGRHTFEEMQGWFTDHTPLILSNHAGFTPAIGHTVTSIAQALAQASAAEQKELVCCGGAQTYAAALPYAHKMVLTIVQHRFDHGAKPLFFPQWKEEHWEITHRVDIASDDQNSWDMSMIHLERRTHA